MVNPPGMPSMQMLNVNNILNVKDSRWLQLEVCREFQRNKCIRPDTECKFAHPPVTVEIQNGRVTACYDSIKGRCNREKPPCKYFHPPQHLKDQLLINGRNHLALKNAFMTQIQGITPGTQLVHSTLPVQASSPYMTSIPTMGNYNPYITSSPMMTVGMTEAVASPLTGVLSQPVVPAQKIPRIDRIEAYSGMGLPYKRAAHDKSGMPVYQPSAAASNAAYQQALMQQLGGQTYVPVTCEYGSGTSNLLALPPPPNAESNSNSHTPPAAIHNASSSSSSATSGVSRNSDYISSITSIPTTTSFTTSFTTPVTSTFSVAGKASSIHAYNNAASPPSIPTLPPPNLPPPPLNVLSYAGYALNKGLGHPPKAPVVGPPPATVAAALPNSATMAAAAGGGLQYALPQGSQYALLQGSQYALPQGSQYALPQGTPLPNSLSGMPLGMGVAPLGLGGLNYQQFAGLIHQQSLVSGYGGYVQAGMPLVSGMPGVGASNVPSVMSPQLVYPPTSSVYLPQITALPNPSQISWASTGGEQPYKKLKTS